MKFLRKDHQWKIGHLVFGALISFIGVLTLLGAAGFFWLQHDLEEKIVQPLLEREVNRVLEGFRSEYLAGGIFIKQMQGLLLESPVSLQGDLQGMARFIEALARRENTADPRFSYIQFGNSRGEMIALNLQGDGRLQFYIQDAAHRGGLQQFDRRPDEEGAAPVALTKGYDPRTRPWYANATAECPQVSPIYFSMGADAQWNASITCPLNRSPQEQGVIAVDLSPARLQKLLDAAVRQSLVSGVFIVDDNDRVLLKSERLSRSERELLLEGDGDKPRFSEFVMSHLAADHSGLINLHAQAEGKFLIYQQPLAGMGSTADDLSHFRVLVISSRDELLSVFDSFFWVSWIALGFILLGAWVLIRVYRGSITFPLMRLREQAEKVAFREGVGAQEFERLYPKGRAIEEIISVQDAVVKMANSLYSLYQELREKVDRDEESGLLSLIGAADRLQGARWEEATVCMVEIGNYAQFSDTLNKTALRHLWHSLCVQMTPAWDGFPRERLVRCRYSEGRLAIVMLGAPQEHQPVLERLQARSDLVLSTGEQEEVRVFLCYGVSHCHERSRAAMDQSLANAVIALRQAQQAGGGFCVFQQAMLEKEARVQALLGAMDSAAIEEEFSMVYQPICDLQSGRMHGVEALMRWQSPLFGAVSPVEFIPLAERSERIAHLGALALRKVSRDVAGLQAEGMLPDGFTAHVNVSARQAMNVHFFEQIRDIAAAAGLAPALLTLELTESLLVDDAHHLREQFRRLSEYGFGLCLDDFGTGYSSLSTLHNFNFGCVKLDRSFIVRATEQGRASAVLPAIVGVARSLRMSCVAEGVETPEQAAVLRAMGCEYVQGYLFARPMPLAQLKAWMAQAA